MRNPAAKMSRVLFLLVAAVSLGASSAALAGSRGSSHSSHHSSSPSKGNKSSGKTVHVKGYTKKDGTQVDAYDRSAPRSKSGSPAAGRTGRPDPGGGPATNAPTTTTEHACTTCERDETGRIKRSQAARADFMRQTGYPHGRPGYVVDHIRPLECGGADAPWNMQWQTVEQAKAKDKTEHNCRS